MTRLSVCSLGISCNEMIDYFDTPMVLVVEKRTTFVKQYALKNTFLDDQTSTSQMVLNFVCPKYRS